MHACMYVCRQLTIPRTHISRGADVGDDMLHPLASPLWAETWAGAPPLMLIGADADLTVDDAVDIGVRARDEGVEVDLCVWPRMFHDWLCYTEGRDKEVRQKRLVVESPWSQFTSECQRF
jgi:acetyl esterase/lipase